MDNCVVAQTLFNAGNIYLYCIVVTAGIAFTKKDWPTLELAIITSLFFAVSNSYHCEIKAVDPERIFRYLIWVSIDLLYLCTVYWLLVKSRRIASVIWKGLVLAHVCIWVLHSIRVIDVHFLPDHSFSNLYGFGISVSNFLIALMVFMGLYSGVRNFSKGGSHG